MYLIRKLSSTSNVFRVTLRNSTTGAGLTGLTSASSGLIISTVCDNEATPTVYTVAGSTIETIATLGTFAAPTATKCRFKEVDATNHKGLYELQIADARFAVAGAKQLDIGITGATSLIDKACTVQFDPAPADTVRVGGTTQTARDLGLALPPAAPNANGGLPILSSSGTTLGYTVTTATTLTNLPAITAGWLTATGIATDAITAAKLATDAGTEIATAVWALGTRTLTAGTNIQLPANGLANITAWTVSITGDLSGSVGSATTIGATGAAVVAAATWSDAVVPSRVPTSFNFADLLDDLAFYHGNGSWQTATGFATAGDVPSPGDNAAAVWAAATRTVTGGTIEFITGLTLTTLETVTGRLSAMTNGTPQFTTTALALAPSGGGGGGVTASEIADAVCDEVLSGHTTPGTVGAALAGASSAGDPWGTTEEQLAAYPEGTAAHLVLKLAVGAPDDAILPIPAPSSDSTKRVVFYYFQTATHEAAVGLQVHFDLVEPADEQLVSRRRVTATAVAVEEYPAFALMRVELHPGTYRVECKSAALAGTIEVVADVSKLSDLL